MMNTWTAADHFVKVMNNILLGKYATRPQIIEDCVRKAAKKNKIRLAACQLPNDAFLLPINFIEDVRTEYRKIMQCA